MAGSDGNSSILRTGNTTIMIDGGFKTKKLMESIFEEIDITPAEIDGIIVTHEHSDHLSSWLGRLAMEHKIPLYLHEKHVVKDNARKVKFLQREKGDVVVDQCDLRIIKENVEFKIGEMNIMPFTAYHDAVKTLGFVINGEFGYLTDCGFISNAIKDKLAVCKHVALEWNYEVEELLFSDRHCSNKIRTFDKFGHLSNEEAEKFTEFLIDNGNLKNMITMHPSNAHNDEKYLKNRFNCNKKPINYFISSRTGISKMIELS
jgi:phosphoribosyl 1,2-cyclic phosphodiesterase